MQLDPYLPTIVAACLGVFVVALLMRRFGQPYVVGYLVAGVVLGPHVLGVVTDREVLSGLGGIGVVLLLFFVGMEISPHRLVTDWKISVIGTGIQVGVSVGCVALLGVILDWNAPRIVLLGFVISLSSTAILVRLLQDRGWFDTPLGGQLIGVTLVQDLAIVPMFIILGLMDGSSPPVTTVALQSIGGVVAIGILVWIVKAPKVKLGLGRLVGQDKELKVLVGLIVCFGLAFLTGLLNLSTALGAFLAGLLVSAARETAWIHEVLEPFRVVLVCVFFVSIGMLLDLDFVRRQWPLVLTLTALVFATNTFINLGVLVVFKSSWRNALWGAAALAPIGEMSFLLAAVGWSTGIIAEFAYQATIATITVSLLLGPGWLALAERVARPDATAGGSEPLPPAEHDEHGPGKHDHPDQDGGVRPG